MHIVCAVIESLDRVELQESGQRCWALASGQTIWPQEFTYIDHCFSKDHILCRFVMTNFDGLSQTPNMLASLRFGFHPTTQHIWHHVHALRPFSISLARSSWPTDPEERRRKYDMEQARERARYAQNAAYRARRMEKQRRSYAGMSESEWRVFYQQSAFRRWVMRGLERGHERSWKTHTPELAEKSDARWCSGCNKLSRKSLWWKRNNESEDKYDVCTRLAIFLGVLTYLGLC